MASAPIQIGGSRTFYLKDAVKLDVTKPFQQKPPLTKDHTCVSCVLPSGATYGHKGIVSSKPKEGNAVEIDLRTAFHLLWKGELVSNPSLLAQKEDAHVLSDEWKKVENALDKMFPSRDHLSPAVGGASRLEKLMHN